MVIGRASVVYVDPNGSDVLSAHPAAFGGKYHGTITVTKGADSSRGNKTSDAAASLSVRVPAKEVLRVVTRLADRLRGAGNSGVSKTIVATQDEIDAARNSVIGAFELSKNSVAYKALIAFSDEITHLR